MIIADPCRLAEIIVDGKNGRNRYQPGEDIDQAAAKQTAEEIFTEVQQSGKGIPLGNRNQEHENAKCGAKDEFQQVLCLDVG